MVLTAFDHMDASYRLDPQWLTRLDTMVQAALGENLTVVLDEHDYEICGKDAAVCKVKLNAFWSQIAPRYKDAPNCVVFEMLNEPHGAMTPELWNAQLRRPWRSSAPRTRRAMSSSVRATGTVSNSFPRSICPPPTIEHIIATFHYYHPMEFTHPGRY